MSILVKSFEVGIGFPMTVRSEASWYFTSWAERMPAERAAAINVKNLFIIRYFSPNIGIIHNMVNLVLEDWLINRIFERFNKAANTLKL